MELTVVLAGIPVRLSLRSPAYAACFQPFWTEADPVAAVRVPEDALKEAAPHYEAGTTPEQVEYLELGPRVCDALLPYGRILFHGAAILWRGRVWVFTANSGTGKTTQYMLWKLCFGSEIKILNGDKPLLEFREGGILVHPSPWRGKEGLGSLDAAPLGGIILLEQSEENRMRRLLPAEAAGPLLRSCCLPARTRTMSAQPVRWRSACWRRCPSGCCKTAATRPRPLCAAIP